MKQPTEAELLMLKHLTKPKNKERFWEDVQIFMTYLYDTYPLDMKAMEDECRFEREGAFNEFSASKGMSMRKLCKMPDMLLRMLDHIYEKQYPITPKQFQSGFWQRYPKLRVAGKK